MAYLIISPLGLGDKDFCHVFGGRKSTASFRPENWNVPKSLCLRDVLHNYFCDAASGGSLFPSPFLVTSTQMDCDNS